MIQLPQQIDQLMGQGFRPQVTTRQSVTAGQPLLGFNLQLLQQLCNPCYGAVIITNAKQLGPLFTSVKRVTAGEDVLLTILAKKKPG